MKKKLIASIAALSMLLTGTLPAGASYSEDLTVYVNQQAIDNNEYKPIIVNDRTLVRLVPVFEALGYQTNDYDAETKSVTFKRGDGAVKAYRFTAESYEAQVLGMSGNGEYNVNETYKLDVPATLQYNDVFYVPIRAFCELVNLPIEWDNPTRSVYIGSRQIVSTVTPKPEKKLLTYEQAKEIAEKHINDSDIGFDINENMVSHNGRQAYAFVLRSKSMIENGGSGTLGMTVYVYADNGEVDDVEEVPGQSGANSALTREKAIELIQAVEGSELSDFKVTKQNATSITMSATRHDTFESGKTDSYAVNFQVTYYPQGAPAVWTASRPERENIPCYEVLSTLENSFDEAYTNGETSGCLLDLDYNVIGVAN